MPAKGKTYFYPLPLILLLIYAQFIPRIFFLYILSTIIWWLPLHLTWACLIRFSSNRLVFILPLQKNVRNNFLIIYWKENTCIKCIVQSAGFVISKEKPLANFEGGGSSVFRISLIISQRGFVYTSGRVIIPAVYILHVGKSTISPSIYPIRANLELAEAIVYIRRPVVHQFTKRGEEARRLFYSRLMAMSCALPHLTLLDWLQLRRLWKQTKNNASADDERCPYIMSVYDEQQFEDNKTNEAINYYIQGEWKGDPL